MSESTKMKADPSQAQQPTPVLSLRDVVVYPYMVIPLFVGRERSILALDKAMDVDKRIVLVTQRSANWTSRKRVTCLKWVRWRLFCNY